MPAGAASPPKLVVIRGFPQNASSSSAGVMRSTYGQPAGHRRAQAGSTARSSARQPFERCRHIGRRQCRRQHAGDSRLTPSSDSRTIRDRRNVAARRSTSGRPDTAAAPRHPEFRRPRRSRVPCRRRWARRGVRAPPRTRDGFRASGRGWRCPPASRGPVDAGLTIADGRGRRAGGRSRGHAFGRRPHRFARDQTERRVCDVRLKPDTALSLSHPRV